jgi:hypothetical protein
MPEPGELPTVNPEAGSGTPIPASTPPPPQPAPEHKPEPPARQPETILDDPIMASLAEDLKELLKVEKEADKLPTIKPVEEAATVAPKPGPEKIQEPVKGAVKKRLDPAKVASEVFDRKMGELKEKEKLPPLPDKPAEQPNPSDTSDLTDEQLEELADAEYAEQSGVEKFKGFSDKLKTFYRKVDEWVKDHESDGERTFDETDEEFKEFVNKVRPDWSGQRDRFRIERISEAKAEQKLKAREKETESKINEAHREAREARYAPKIQSIVSSITAKYDEETKSDDPLEREVFDVYRNASAELCNDYLRILHGIDTISENNPPPVRQRHDWLVNFVLSSADAHAKRKPEETMRNGRKFVTPARMAALRTAKSPEAEESWTFSPEDVLEMIRLKAIELAKAGIKQEESRIVKRGFVRSKPTGSSKQAESPKPMNPPRATSPPSPGARETTSTIDERHMGREIVEELGLDR